MNIEEVFEYNQHFVAMMNIINLAKLTNNDDKFEKHHIIPRCYFNKHNLPVDNSENNLVKLTTEQHRKVHKLAALCATEEMKTSLKYAASLMNRESVIGDKNPNYGVKCSDEKRKKISNSVKQAYEEGKLNTSGENNGMFGKKPWCYGKHLSEETKKKISESRKGKPSWNKCKKCGPLSEERKRKISESNKGKKRSDETKNKIAEAMKEYRKTHPITTEQHKKAAESRQSKKRGKYKKKYTTRYIGSDGKRVYK